MPLFEYLCRNCEKQSEILVRNDEMPECAYCGSTRLEKLLSRFAPVSAGADASAPVPCGQPECSQYQNGSCPMR